MKLSRLLRLQAIFYDKYEKRLADSIKHMVGSKPFNLNLYKLSLKHASISEESINGLKISNERLEYLGDAILGSVVAEFLFLKFPFRDEGFLTETRSRMVNREALNQIAIKIGLSKVIEKEYKGKNLNAHKSIFGDTLEALVGAVYLDRGYAFCKKFILKRIIIHFDVDDIINTTANFKSKIIEWSQKENKEIDFKMVAVSGNQRFKEFLVELCVDGNPLSEGKGSTKKKAEQEAAKNACEKLNIAI
ncbi:Ribonuclease III [Indibacter alkaliphilus LW1]|uniref:Ribonuclease 3 n=1 Tax=Indibacter alkaliphilus (strain CCUG 57479 / KCTC 22604 / LW1) TaxID=1189612 RepID=S2E400_INDAL|nr:ribonuclease III [Indibacter alkaliphilus]EOZ96943.1 Ribonuclease III [Indibacter alkaliphilus LW1]